MWRECEVAPVFVGGQAENSVVRRVQPVTMMHVYNLRFQFRFLRLLFWGKSKSILIAKSHLTLLDQNRPCVAPRMLKKALRPCHIENVAAVQAKTTLALISSWHRTHDRNDFNSLSRHKNERNFKLLSMPATKEYDSWNFSFFSLAYFLELARTTVNIYSNQMTLATNKSCDQNG